MKLFPSLLLFSATFLAAEEKVSFNQEIRPILSEKCYFCHGPDAEDIKGKLQLHTFDLATQERLHKSRSGKIKKLDPAIIPGNAEDSLLWERLTTDDPDEIMPPPKRHSKVTEKELASIKKWIEQGAEYEELWSLKPLPKEVAIPAQSAPSAKNAIDHFVGAALKKEGLHPAKEADPELLLRRVYLTLTGLVPSPEQISEFKNDQSGKAYENLVDKLLSSQQFSEHLAVDWMDAARYADSYGYQTDGNRHVWPWRDWVLNAFQKNMPYDEFIKQQLAGDLLPNSDDQMKLATAFNRLHMQKKEGGSVPEEFRTEYVADRSQTAATVFLGLTMECCRCHDHKYDPISQEDYFKTFALFNNIDEAGLYSFFTSSIPSPSMPILKDDERKLLKTKENTRTHALAKLHQIKKDEAKNFTTWKKTWNQKVGIKGLVGDFSFDDALKNKIPNAVDKTKAGSFNASYSKIVDGKKGKAILLDGDSELKFGPIGPYERHRDFSFSLWINTPIEHQRAVILHRSQAWTDAASRGYELLVDEGKLSFALVHYSPGNEIRIRAKENLKLDDWQQVTMTYDGSSKAKGLKLYIDGTLLETEVIKDNLTKEIWYKKPLTEKQILAQAKKAEADKKDPKAKKKKKNNGKQLAIGARMRDMGFKNSKVDELKIFDRRLTSLEVRENFQAGTKAINDDELYEYYLSQVNQKYQEAYSDLMAKRGDYNEYYRSRFHMMVMKEMPERRKTYVLKRGLYSTPDLEREVEPGPPSKIFPFGKEYSRDRLGFAQWLTHPEHPLTARVTVNRYWQMVFSQGLVTTTNDFGSQGAFPSHPHLLDYLSRDFIDTGWDVRALFKKMVMSATFRQDSSMTKELHEKDPDNKLLARGPSYYMTAEMLRDNALYTAGLLSDKLGGASAKPYNPQNNKYRRSLYTQWRRSEPSPEMLIFGAPRRQICSVKREKTSTPLQPLVLMNSPQVIESARSLASQVLKEDGDSKSKLKSMYKRLTGSEVNKEQLQILEKLLNEQETYFQNSPDVAKNLRKVGKSTVKDKDDITLAAWTVMANTILNLDSYYMLR
ncbi:DUF1553 domain-containing protein [Lentisphaera profundi]|uniref:DUF1553 domain-containing protein n=1 Tax=Lentisphaera profundi TaxID=1658616 RepID=A0ABY7W053_9BACT|nr:DUF1553 domain-containing protein [Lentisphaera profundi]WDE98815.1 DUF1553 domain-containing protein [Lentisphaera profundi]